MNRQKYASYNHDTEFDDVFKQIKDEINNEDLEEKYYYDFD